MLEASWEAYATSLANAQNEEELVACYEHLISSLKINASTPAHVILARDTRESGPALVTALIDALTSIGAKYDDYGILTTPQLHYLVRCLNTQHPPHSEPYGEPTEEGYYKKIGSAYAKLLQGKPRPGPITVDCANGVGAPKLKALAEYIGKEIFDVKIVNDLVDQPSKLNYQVSLPNNLSAGSGSECTHIQLVWCRFRKNPATTPTCLSGFSAGSLCVP